MLLGNLVKFKVPCIAKYCNQYGTSDFIIDDALFGVVVGWEKNHYLGSHMLEIFAAGELLFSIDPDDVVVVKEKK